MESRKISVLLTLLVVMARSTVNGRSHGAVDASNTIARYARHVMEEDDDDEDVMDDEDEEKTGRAITKRALPALLPFLGIIGSALGASTAVGVAMYQNIDKKTCGIIIGWAAPRGRPGANINFMSVSENNWNHETLDTDGNVYHVDSTTERVDGGPLKMIQFWWDKGTAACVKYISFTCGESVLGGKKVLVFDESTFTRRARKQGKTLHYIHNHRGQGTCVWFSHNRFNIRAVDFYAGVFNCGPWDTECKANNIEIFVN